MTSTTPARRQDPGRARVTDVSVVVLAHPGGPHLDLVLTALAGQQQPPSRVLVCGLDPHGEEAEAALAHPGLAERRIPVIVRAVPDGVRPRVPAGDLVDDGDATDEVDTDRAADDVDHGGDGGDGGDVDHGDGRDAPDQRPGEDRTDAVAAEQPPAPVPSADPLDRWRLLEDARGALPVHEDNWMWILHDDSRPAPGALAALTAAVRRSSRVGMVGPKLVRAEDPRLLVGVGHQITPAGRPADPRQAALVDQGQLDLRQDVLAVPLAGALVRSDLLDRVGGIDRAFGSDGVDGLDVGWRLHLSGHRVVVAPDAVVAQGWSGLGVEDLRRTRVRTRQVALARGSLPASALRALGVVVTSTLAALLLLLVKRPAEAADEWADVRAALAPARGWGARWRFRGRRTVRPRDLHGLFTAPGSGTRSVLDTVGAALDPRSRPAEAPEGRTRRGAATETGPVSEEMADLGPGRVPRRRWSWPLAAALLAAVVLAAWRWRDVLGALRPGAAGLSGGELGPGITGAHGLWRSALDAWRGGGLGHDHPPEPWLVAGSALTSLVEMLPGGAGGSATAGVALAWVLVLALPASVVTAYLGLRRATRRRWVRGGLALGYAGLSPLGVALADGRVGPVIVHVLAPLLLAGYAVSAARGGGTRRAAAVFATVLGVVVAGQWVPLLLVVSTLGGAALLVVGRGGARWRGAVLALLPWALMLPWLPALWHDPVRLLGGAGATLAREQVGPAAQTWQLALLHPGDPVAIASAAALPLWATVPLWLAALLAVVVRGPAGRRALVLVSSALGCLGLALVADRLVLGTLPTGHLEAGQIVSPWSGTLLSLTAAALVLAVALLVERLVTVVDGLRRSPGEEVPRGAGPLVLATTVLAVGLPAVATLATVGSTLLPPASSLAAAADPLPAVAAEQGRGPSALRTLVIDPAPADDGGSNRLDVDLVGAEPEPARILRDRAAELAAGVPDHAVLEDLVVGLAGGSPEDQVVAELQDLAVGFVHVRAGEDSPVVDRLDRIPGLTRVSSPAGEVLWRLSGTDASRVRVLDADGRVLDRLTVVGPHGAADGEVSDLPEGAVLRVSEGSGWAATASATVDGRAAQIADDGSIDLPAGTHEVTVSPRSQVLPWHIAAGVLGLITVFLALPFGRPEEQEVRP